jgi:putative transposase
MSSNRKELAMPWEVFPVSQLRTAFVHQVLTLGDPVAAACRKFGISRKTGHKWLRRFHRDPALPLTDLSRRPRLSPGRTDSALEQAILQIRDQFGWGARKIRACLLRQGRTPPSTRTVSAILHRHQRLVTPPPPEPLQRFERARPNELWQCDFKGPLEVERRTVHPFTVLDDHSRFLLTLLPCLDQTMRTAWSILWDLFGDVGLPEALLCDNAFGTRGPGLSWFEGQLLRLGIRTLHGRPYHPQTQGKVERLHGTLQREVWPRVRRDTLVHFRDDVTHWRTVVYNAQRPHEALGDAPPLARWQPSSRPRPAFLPEVTYPKGAVLRKVSVDGSIHWKGCRILVGQGICGQFVRVEERDCTVAVYYAATEVRCLGVGSLRKDRML